MGGAQNKLQAGGSPAAATGNIDLELDHLASAKIDELRTLWRVRHGTEAPAALSKDLIARALSHALQEKSYGGLEPRLLRIFGKQALSSSKQDRHVKVGSIMVREHDGIVHEVMVVPGGFCWQGKVYASLSTIAKRITGTSWNGPRFFGLRGKERTAVGGGSKVGGAESADTKCSATDAGRVQIPGARRRIGSKAAP